MNLLYDFPTAFSIFKTTRDSMQTDLDESNLKRLYDIAKNISYDNVIHKVVDGNPKDQTLCLKAKLLNLAANRRLCLCLKSNYDYSEIQALREIYLIIKNQIYVSNCRPRQSRARIRKYETQYRQRDC